MLRKALVIFPCRLIQHQEDEIETRQQSSRKVDVLDWRELDVVPAVEGVGSRENRRPGIQRSRDAGFRDRDRLLFHDLVDGGAVGFLHLVELIDAADAVVGQYERTSLCANELETV
jgi:hypothetical protein